MAAYGGSYLVAAGKHLYFGCTVYRTGEMGSSIEFAVL
jgi:hypothetical protein